MQAYPLQWPTGWKRTPPQERKRAAFNKKTSRYVPSSMPGGQGYTQTSSADLSIDEATKRVLGELRRLSVQFGDAIISTNLVLRLDGLPKSGQAQPPDPGAAVYWRREHSDEMKVMAIDRYDRVADNLAAIAATLDAMRAIERHGGAQILERAFTGFDALPAPQAPHQVLKVAPNATEAEINAAFRALAPGMHPDRGGDVERFKELTAARDKMLRGLRQ